ncbi:MAG: 50S ribosomal protein L24 [Lactobacillus crispatus]|nr:50S ribosomal protein L24 [Lactobacillus crispatus]
MFVKTGDKVKVIAGKDKGKGKEGTVLSVNVKKNRVVVKGVNKIKKHQKPSQSNANGGVVESEGSIHASNVKVISSKKEDK